MAALAALGIGLGGSLAGCTSFQTAQQERSADRALASEPQQLVERARVTVLDARTDPSFGNAPDLLRRARAVLIAPQIIKGGFFVGGEGGDAVLLARNSGVWTDPAFYTLASASLGIQIGLQSAELVMFVMSDRALQALLQKEFKFGAQASLAVITIGSNAQAASSPDVDADIIVWAKAQGVYAGLTLEGSVLKPRASYNQVYYGQPVTPADVVLRASVFNPAADPLRLALTAP
jgi:lipid-binding SYLF domain-containing protein